MPTATASSTKSIPFSCLPYGIGHHGEGVCLLVQMGDYRVLLDCGLTNIDQLVQEQTADHPSKPPIDFVFCSHAHRDHAEGLLKLQELFPELPIYASSATKALLPLNWTGQALSLDSVETLPWRSPTEIAPGLIIELFPAGHLPGAATALLTLTTEKRDYTLFYTGDFSVSHFQLVNGLSVEELRGLKPDVLIIEGSYGTLRHPHRRQQEKYFTNRLLEALETKQSVILPVPRLGLGQEILKLLRSHHQFTGKKIDIWVEGNVAKACDQYLDILQELPLTVQNFAKHQALFWDDRVYPRMHRLKAKEYPDLSQGQHIIITDYTNDFGQYCSNSENTCLLLLPEHPGVWLNFDEPPLAAIAPQKNVQIETYLLAEHSDGRNTTQLIHNLRPQHIIFFHGSDDDLSNLTALEELQNRYQLHCPAAGSLVELPVGETFIQPAVPQRTEYEGEINDLGAWVTLSLPNTICEDPRWQTFADTGLVEAHWQGEELVIRGINERELLRSQTDLERFANLDCCINCRFQKSMRCQQQKSPLYRFKVTPEGYCPEFEAIAYPTNLDS
ncbi:metallo-beta-lactamase domain-containing protein [[Leptolyngbya] sp. PCC 7376]|uniref:MBL fold metallo-hydrolase n=1 Tax=[Leptolyngbya] sp. PCC 7376 TaxID=111781 RepID=UPI00029F060F|nr:MBL fold metallo-hydrolase [[Leptolyngbya] sp. PCC 7376]AFY39126.1 metallo-beta-lactamase domain-containing protein [[Leptolyngbya] sp. PCC 7376]